MKKTIFICIISLISINQNVKFQELHFDTRQYISEKGDTLNYRISFPDNNPSEFYPVIIFLHGSGERGNDNLAQLKWGVKNFATDEVKTRYKPIVIVPQSPDDSRWSNFEGNVRGTEPLHLADTPSKSMQLTMELLDEIIANYSVDKNRIYITGLSMGGFGTWDAIARWPDRFAAAVPVCGGGDPTTVDRFADLPIWVFHGLEDPTVPVERSRQMVEALREVGGKPGFTEYPSVGHFSWIQTYKDDNMMSWLFSQRRKPIKIDQ